MVETPPLSKTLDPNNLISKLHWVFRYDLIPFYKYFWEIGKKEREMPSSFYEVSEILILKLDKDNMKKL